MRKGLNKIKLKAYKGVSWDIDYIEFIHKLPDIVEAENFDNFDGVLVVDDDEKSIRRVGYQKAGDYYDYNVNVENAGLYAFDFYVSSKTTTGAFKLKDQNGKVLTSVTVPKTGDSKIFKVVSKEVYLTKDINKLVVEVTGESWDFDKFDCHLIGPRRIQAEECYDQYGISDFIDDNGSQYIGALDEGDFSSYKVSVREAGDYNLNLKVSSKTNDGVVRIEDKNGKVLDRINIPYTGDNNKWKEINKTIPLKKGSNIIKLYAEYRNFNIDFIEFSHIPPKCIRAYEFSDTNTATLKDGLVNLKEGDYLDYNIWNEYAGDYKLKIEAENTNTNLEINIEDDENRVLNTIKIQDGDTSNIYIKQGLSKLRLYVKKGTGSIGTLSIYNAISEIIHPEETINARSMITQRTEHVSVVLNDKMYAISGMELYDEGITKKVEVYSPASNNWKPVKAIPIPVS